MPMKESINVLKEHFVLSSLGNRQICSYELHFVLLKLIKYHFTAKPPHYYYTNQKPLVWAFIWYPGGGLGPILEPKPSLSPSWPSWSCQIVSAADQKKIISSSVLQRHPYYHTINSFMLWTLCLYHFNAMCGRLMVLCPDDKTPCPKVILSTRRRLIGGLFAPPPSTFWRRRGNRTSPGRTVLVWRRGRCGACAILVAAFATAARRTMRISVMRQQRIMH